MNKKILIGSIIAVVILLLMPSISAIQQRAIKDRAYDDLFEQLDDVDFKDVKEINTLDLGERVKHPLLYIFVFTLGAIRGIRGFYLMMNSSNFPGMPEGLEINNPLIFYRGAWLSFTAIVWIQLWRYVGQKMGWNWEE